MGYLWQHAHYFWHLAKCCKTTGDLLWKGFPLLAVCHCSWQGAKSGKSPILVIEVIYVFDQDLGGSGGVPTILGSLPNAVNNGARHWQCAILAGKVPTLVKVPGRSITRQRDVRCYCRYPYIFLNYILPIN